MKLSIFLILLSGLVVLGQAPAPQAAQQDEIVPITLRFDNADIYQVIRIFGETLGLNYVIDPTIKGTVNLSTTGNLRRSELLPILETILKINGATMVRTGNFYEIVPAAAGIRQPLPVQQSAQAQPDDQMVVHVVRMRFVSAAEMARLLTPYLSEGANIVTQETGNILLISDRRSNLRKLLEIVDIFDTAAFEGERVRMFPVKYTIARDLVEDLKTIFSGYALSDRAAIRFMPVDRMNSILVMSANSDVFPEVEKWLARLDQQVQTSGVKNFVYRVKNAKAIDIQRVLSSLYSPAMPAQQQTPATPSPTIPPISGAPAPAQAGAAAPTLSRPAVVANGNIRMVADEINNALIIQATPQEYSEIEQTILELDTLPRQVLIDAQVYEVVLDDSLFLGLSATLQNRGTLSNPQTTASFSSGAAGGPPVLAAQTFAFVGRSRELIGFLNASENRSRVRTLSAPSVLVSDNMTAQFQVGTEVPVPTSSSVTPVQSGGTNLFAQTIQFRNTGVILQVKPQINESRNVTLEIAQEVSEAGANTSSAIVAPVIGKSSVSSTVVVQDGQTIALGGFIRENNDLSRSRVPLIGRVPGLGVLFGNTRRANSRTELIILITPHVILNHKDNEAATEELKARLKEIKGLLK